MAFVFVLEAGEVIRHTLLFQAMFLQFSCHKWLFSSFWKEGKLIITLCHFNSCFCYFLHVNYFCFRSGSRGSYSTPFAISIRFSSIFLTSMTSVFVLEAGQVIDNILLILSMCLSFCWHKWRLFSFWKKGKLFVTLCYFIPCFLHFLEINDFCFRFWSRRSYL